MLELSVKRLWDDTILRRNLEILSQKIESQYGAVEKNVGYQVRDPRMSLKAY